MDDQQLAAILEQIPPEAIYAIIQMVMNASPEQLQALMQQLEQQMQGGQQGAPQGQPQGAMPVEEQQAQSNLYA